MGFSASPNISLNAPDTEVDVSRSRLSIVTSMSFKIFGSIKELNVS